ncbi:PPE family protein, partial [Mycobacterium interjectum]|nr:PPE family protein [Mycobacterium interjectum]
GPVASVVNAPRGDGPRARSRHKVVAALPGEQEDPAAPWVKPGAPADGDGAVSEREELAQLRKAVADVTRQRDVLKRTAATLIKEGTQK